MRAFLQHLAVSQTISAQLLTKLSNSCFGTTGMLPPRDYHFCFVTNIRVQHENGKLTKCDNNNLIVSAKLHSIGCKATRSTDIDAEWCCARVVTTIRLACVLRARWWANSTQLSSSRHIFHTYIYTLSGHNSHRHTTNRLKYIPTAVTTTLSQTNHLLTACGCRFCIIFRIFGALSAFWGASCRLPSTQPAASWLGWPMSNWHCIVPVRWRRVSAALQG